jgi:uncharacterized membrane protein required for colicin V production
MDPIAIASAIKKNGMVGLLTLILVLMFNYFTSRLDAVEGKLERVESKLYDCLEDRIQTSDNDMHSSVKYPELMAAILTKELEYGTKRKMAV